MYVSPYELYGPIGVGQILFPNREKHYKAFNQVQKKKKKSVLHHFPKSHMQIPKILSTFL